MLKKTILAGAAAAALALGGASLAASADAAQVAAHYSQFLAGYALQGNGVNGYNDVRGTVTVPAGTEVTGVAGTTPDAIAVGIALGANVSTGGHTFGLGLVWDDNRTTYAPTGADYLPTSDFTPSTCAADQWTVEYGRIDNGTGPAPVPTADLVPLIDFGSDQCVDAGDSYYLEMYESTGHANLAFIAGPTESDNDELADLTGVHGGFKDPGVGITTTSGPDAATLNASDILASYTRVGIDELLGGGTHAPTKRLTFDAPNYGEYTGTTTSSGTLGGGNVITLQPSSFGVGSAFDVAVGSLP